MRRMAARDCSDSATATPTANWPPTPRPVRPVGAKSHTLVEKTLTPVNSE